MHRYSAKLLFQFRVDDEAKQASMRLCEERIIHYPARTDRAALAQAKRKGKSAQVCFPNTEEQPVYFEFVGVLDLVRIVGDDPGEVWYEIKRRKLPMERRNDLLPSDEQLLNHT